MQGSTCRFVVVVVAAADLVTMAAVSLTDAGGAAVESWSVKQVAGWLNSVVGLDAEAAGAFEEQLVDGATLVDLTAEEAKLDLGLKLGQQKALFRALTGLRAGGGGDGAEARAEQGGGGCAGGGSAGGDETTSAPTASHDSESGCSSPPAKPAAEVTPEDSILEEGSRRAPSEGGDGGGTSISGSGSGSSAPMAAATAAAASVPAAAAAPAPKQLSAATPAYRCDGCGDVRAPLSAFSKRQQKKLLGGGAARWCARSPSRACTVCWAGRGAVH